MRANVPESLSGSVIWEGGPLSDSLSDTVKPPVTPEPTVALSTPEPSVVPESSAGSVAQSDLDAARRRVRASRLRCRAVFVGLVVVLVAVFFGSFMVGRYPIGPVELVSFLFSKVFTPDVEWPREYEVVVFTIRLPRILAAGLVGTCLSVAGLSFQALFKNPMAAPDVMGASSGAAFGAALAIFFHLGNVVTGVSAFVFGLVAVLIAYGLSLRMRHNPLLGMVLAGIMIGSLFNAAVSVLKLVADVDETLPAITYWLMGSVSNVKMAGLTSVLAPMLVGLAGLFAMRGRLNVLALGEDEARSLGVNTKACRVAVVLFATLVTAASVSISGIIGWVGLVIPHFARMLVGENQRFLMPSTMVMGAAFLMAVDDLARSVAQIDVPLGILTAFVGAPFFIYLVMRKETK